LKAGRGTADSLNNRALSYLDLGKEAEAETAWQAALMVDPQHLDTVYNRGVLLWRKGELQHDTLVQKLQSVAANNGDPWQAKYMLGMVHLEWGNVNKATALLEEAARRAPSETEVQRNLKRARSGNADRSRCVLTFKGHTQAVTSVYMSADKRFVLSGSADKTLRLWDAATGNCMRIFGRSSESRILIWMVLALVCILFFAVPLIFVLAKHLLIPGLDRAVM